MTFWLKTISPRALCWPLQLYFQYCMVLQEFPISRSQKVMQTQRVSAIFVIACDFATPSPKPKGDQNNN